MKKTASNIPIKESRLVNWQPAAPDLWKRIPEDLSSPDLEVSRTLLDQPPWLNAAYLYDKKGSRLFERICELPEYYLTRTEDAILEEIAEGIIETVRPRILVEFGAGLSTKTMRLLEETSRQCGPSIFVPIDVSQAALQEASGRIQESLPQVTFQGLVARYEEALQDMERPSGRLFLFLGSTVGNLGGGDFLRFFSLLADNMVAGDFLLLGVDRVKDTAVLEAAYNDSLGITAEFILNAFDHVNRLAGSNFERERMEYCSEYNRYRQQVEMSAVCLADQEIRFPGIGVTYNWLEGERILVEISRKFEPVRLTKMLRTFGLNEVAHSSDSNRYFSILLFEKQGSDFAGKATQAVNPDQGKEG